MENLILLKGFLSFCLETLGTWGVLILIAQSAGMLLCWFRLKKLSAESGMLLWLVVMFICAFCIAHVYFFIKLLAGIFAGLIAAIFSILGVKPKEKR